MDCAFKKSTVDFTACPKILIGNKCDIKERIFSKEEGQSLALKYKMPFFETSAKTGKE